MTSILEEADKLINGEKKEAYGDPKDNLEFIAEQWSLYINQDLATQGAKYGVQLSAEDVCWMMALLKMCRNMHKQGRDNIVDAAGYIGLIEKVGEPRE